MRKTLMLAAALVALDRPALGQNASVEFRVVERHATPISTVTGTSNNVLNYAVQARVTGAANTGLATCSFSIQMPGEQESSGVLAINTITNVNGTYWTGAIDSTSTAGGLKAGVANAYRYLVGINGSFNGLINASGGAWTNNPIQQDIGLVTPVSAGSNYLAYTDPLGHGFPDSPLNPATQLNPYFGANQNWIDLYRFQYTVTNLSSNRTVPINIFLDGTVAVFSTSQMSGGLWGPLTMDAVSSTVTGTTFNVNVIGACCDSSSALCTLNSASGCTGGTFQGVGSTCTAGLCPGGACCFISTGACTFTGASGCVGNRVFRGVGTTCAANPCPPGSCCATDGTCAVLIQSACAASWTSGGTCSPNTCPQPGTCCSLAGFCTTSLQAACSAGASWMQGGTCSPNTCPQPGQCCTAGGGCTVVLQSVCGGGVWTFGASCAPNNCPQPGTCCAGTGGCSFVLLSACSGGSVWFSGGTCTPNSCPQPGSCCATTGICTVALQSACTGGSVWTLSGVCTPNPCPQPGTCCMSLGACTFVLQTMCAGQVTWTVGGTCSPNTCPQPGTCCAPTGVCSFVLQIACAGGSVWTSGGVCSVNACPQPGRCCAASGVCAFVLQSACAGGSVWTLGGTCTPNPCPQPGVCCAFDGNCTMGLQSACVGAFGGTGSCAPNQCPQPGTCCATSGACSLVLQITCAGGSIWSAGGSCSLNPCPPPGACCGADGLCSTALQNVCAGVWNIAQACVPNPCAQPHQSVLRTVRAAGPGAIAPWTTATPSLASALSASVAGDEVWIAAGTYTPTVANGDRSLSFVIPSGVRVYGGFAGTETIRSQRSADTTLNPTVLSGDLNGNDGAGFAGSDENSQRVVVASNTASTTVLDRVTVRGGNGTPAITFQDVPGAGMYGVNAHLLLTDCTFRDNRTSLHSTSNDRYGIDGGAIALESSAPLFIRCVITSNRTAPGSGVGCTSGVGQLGGVGGSGGGVSLSNCTSAFVDCVFSNNMCGNGSSGAGCSSLSSAGRPGGSGGAVFATNTSASFLRCQFSGNFAGNGGPGGTFSGASGANGPGGSGGALFLAGGSAVFTSCMFASNAAGSGSGGTAFGTTGASGGSGGAIFASGAAVSVLDSVLNSNTSGTGGNGQLDISGCSRAGGAAGAGGAIALTGGTFTMSACTVTANNSGLPGAGSTSTASGSICISNPPCCQPGATGATGIGGVAGDTLSASIIGCILWNNGNGQIAFPNPTIAQSCVQGGAPGNGNISSDPLFINAAAGDFRLAPGSPCIDAGNNAALPATVGADVAGNARFVSGCSTLQDTAPDATIDMGAYEYQGAGADCDADGVCDLREVSGLQILRAASAAPGQKFGWNIKMRGDVAVIGARGTNTNAGTGAGVAYIYERQGSVWGNRQTLAAADGRALDDFGNYIGISDNWVVVAARGADAGGLTDSGAVYVYQRDAIGWAQSAKIVAPDGQPGNLFGHGVAIDQDRIVVGALYGDSPSVADTGAAYVFKHNGAGWVLEAKLLPADLTPLKGFGICVAIQGDMIAVGAPYDGNVGSAGGATYIYQRFGTSWVQVSKLLPSDNNDHTAANFGELVAMSGDRLICNAPRLSHTGRSQAGAAYIFRRSGSAWIQEARLVSDSPQGGEWFSFDVAIDGDRAMVGGFRRSVLGQPVAGAAYVFRRFGTSWLMASHMDAPSPYAFGYFGYGIGLSGTRAIVGGFQLPAGTVQMAGAARVFDLNLLDGNQDGIPDACQITSGTLTDADNNGIPDVVQFNPCRADFNSFGGVTVQDIFDFLSVWFTGGSRGDFNGSGGLEPQDIFDFLGAWFAGC